MCLQSLGTLRHRHVILVTPHQRVTPVLYSLCIKLSHVYSIQCLPSSVPMNTLNDNKFDRVLGCNCSQAVLCVCVCVWTKQRFVGSKKMVHCINVSLCFWTTGHPAILRVILQEQNNSAPSTQSAHRAQQIQTDSQVNPDHPSALKYIVQSTQRRMYNILMPCCNFWTRCLWGCQNQIPRHKVHSMGPAFKCTAHAENAFRTEDLPQSA